MLIYNALNERGIKCELKFLKPENKAKRLAYCKASYMTRKWANIACTDEMSIEIGGNFGVPTVWREEGEKWEQTCVGAVKKPCPTIMCWGMIAWNCKVRLPDSIQYTDDNIR